MTLRTAFRTPLVLYKGAAGGGNGGVATSMTFQGRLWRYRPVETVRPCSYWTNDCSSHNNDARAARQRQAAFLLLGLSPDTTGTTGLQELRAAYFVAAKQSHPDTTSPAGVVPLRDFDATERFRAVTEAYELLLGWVRRRDGTMLNKHGDEDNGITVEEEDEYRQACLEWLGQSAETIEESKQCPLFRQWLCGRTDAAFHWQNFFMLHGGLAPKLRQSRVLLAGTTTITTTKERCDNEDVPNRAVESDNAPSLLLIQRRRRKRH